MKKAILAIFIICAFKGKSQVLTPVNGYGQKHQRIQVDSFLKPPSDTIYNAPLNAFAIKSGILYIRKSNKWEAYASIDTAKYFKQNGNTFNANAHLGTNDNYHLYFKTNGVDQIILGSDGSFYSPTQGWVFNTDGSFQLATDAGFSLNGDLRVPNNRYINFATNDSHTGSSGFGFRSLNGVLQRKDSLGSWVSFASTAGTVTSVSATVPTGLTVTGTPITNSGTLAFTWTSGYTPVTTTEQTNWQSAYLNRITSATLPLSITSNVISIADASGSASGVVTTSAQTIAGAKTFTSALKVGSFTTGTGVNASIFTNGEVRATNGYNLNAPTNSDNLFYGIKLNSTRQVAVDFNGTRPAIFDFVGSGSSGYLLNLSDTYNPSSGSGTVHSLRANPSITPGSGSNTITYNMFTSAPTINQGTFGTGIIRGFFHSPTITTLNTSIHRAWENTTGDVIIASTSGRTGIVGVTSPTAWLHLGAGTASANSAPFKYTAGTSLTTPENGAKEYDGSNEFLTAGGVRYTMAKTLTTTSVLDFSSTSSQSSNDLTVTLTGASDGDVVNIGVPNGSSLNNSCYTAWVSSANTVTIRFNNYSSGSQDPASGTYRLSIIKY